MNNLKREYIIQVIIGDVAGGFLNEFIVHIAYRDWRWPLAELEGNEPVSFRSELKDGSKDVAEV